MIFLWLLNHSNLSSPNISYLQLCTAFLQCRLYAAIDEHMELWRRKETKVVSKDGNEVEL